LQTFPVSLILVLVSSMLCGCAHLPFVTQPYPRWGSELWLSRNDRDGLLPMRVQMPARSGAAPGCLLIVHGMNEYIGRYGEIAAYFAKHFIVAGFDLYAHGLSNPALLAADRAIAEGAAEVDVSEAYLAQAALRDLEPLRQDLDQALRRLIEVCDRQGAPGRPIFILSHSLGSLIAASYLLAPRLDDDPRARVQGIVFCGPAFSVTEVPGWRGYFQTPFVKLAFYAEEHFLRPQGEPLPWLIANQILALATVPLLDGVFEVLSWPGLRQIFSPTTPDWVPDYLSDWDEERARHRVDGYIIRRSLLRYVKGVEEEIVRFRRQMAGFATPYLLIYADGDPITPAWGNQDFAEQTFRKHPDNQLLPLPDKVHHEQLFSAPPLRDELLKCIELWLNRRLKSIREVDAQREEER
jgi:alpha-beta hydrolase superfamily lysophospholipase